MKETWMANGVRLAWLIDPYEEKAYIYRKDGQVEVVAGFDGQLLQKVVRRLKVAKSHESRQTTDKTREYVTHSNYLGRHDSQC
ncbi:MAG: hypothetical protein J5I98_25405 [Phaeodactylibacter sp.]|nr:hypothetical protein [Phaeodactylibacter sp.]